LTSIHVTARALGFGERRHAGGGGLSSARGVQARDLEGVMVHVAALAADEIPTSDVVDVTVVVVVAAVAGNLLGIGPEIRAHVDVGRVDAVIDDGDEHRASGLTSGEQLATRTLGADARHTIRVLVEQLPLA